MKMCVRVFLVFAVMSLSLTAAEFLLCSDAVPGSPGASAPVGYTLEEMLFYFAPGTGFGCLDGDKLYSNWTYGGGVAESAIDVNIFTSVNPNTQQDIHIVQLVPSALGDVWFDSIIFGYTISVLPDPNGPQRYISDAIFEVDAPEALAASKALLIAGHPLIELAPNDRWRGQATSIDVSVILIPGGGGATSITDRYTQTLLPEPGTYALFGAGLLALGLLRRRLT